MEPPRRVRGAATRLDPLTGALQRAALESTFAAIRRRATCISLLLVDLDHFKSINDAFGHARGDAVLQEFGVRARTVLRGGDLLIRYGGDEFVVLLPNARLAKAHEAAERLLAAVKGQALPGVAATDGDAQHRLRQHGCHHGIPLPAGPAGVR